MLTGPDVSRYQPDWTPQPGDDFVFIKATEGRTVTNPLLAQQTARARAAGLVVGFYHFLWPRDVPAQVDYFLRQAGSRPGDLLVCDWEKTNGGIPFETDKDDFLAEVRRLRPQNKAGLYVNASMWNASNKWAGDFLWCAHYGVDKPRIVEPWLFWQWTDKPIDQNRAQFNSREELRAWARNEQEDDVALTDADKAWFTKTIDERIEAALPRIWKSAAVDILKVPTASDPNNTYTPASVLEQIRRKVD